MSSSDSKLRYSQNKLNDFTVEFDREIQLSNDMVRNRVSQNYCVALTELSVDSSPYSGARQALPESCVILCDICDNSYIKGTRLPVLRILPAANESTVSLFQPYYVGVKVESFIRIRIQIKTRELEALDAGKWELDNELRCTLHFLKV